MKISFTTMATPELNLLSQVRAAQAYGFDGVDLRVIEKGMGEIPKTLSPSATRAVQEALRPIEVPSLLTYNEKIQSGSHTMESSILSYLRLASQLNIPAIRVFTGKVESGDDMKNLIRVFRSVLQKNTSGVRLAIQNHVNSSVNLHQALEICKRIGDPCVSLVLSPDQAVIQGEDYQTLLPQLAHHVSQLYVADLDGENRYVLQGRGNLPYQKMLYTLMENGFDGYVTLKWEKCWYPELPSWQEAFEAFLTWFHRCVPQS